MGDSESPFLSRDCEGAVVKGSQKDRLLTRAVQQRILLMAILALWTFGNAAAQSLLIQGATVVDGTGAAPARVDVLVENGRVAAIGAKLRTPPEVSVVDGRGKTLLPGMFDLHTHVSAATVGGSGQDWGKNLKAYLLAGVTSVADFGAYGESYGAVRELIEKGTWQAPRLHFASRLTTPGGHGLEIGRGEVFTQEVFTASEGRAAVERVAEYKPDVIKVFTDGWRYGTSADMTSMEVGTLDAIVKAAHQQKLPVLTHTVTVAKGKVAARAGVDAIMHGLQDVPVDEELIALMKKSRIAYGPTSAVYEPRAQGEPDVLLSKVLDPASKELLRKRPAFAKPNAQRIRKFAVLKRNTLALHKAGVPIVTGTDAGIAGTHHGWATLREITLLVESGLTPVEAIRAATLNAARVLHVDAVRGSIEPGKAADLVLVNGAPHVKVSDVLKVERVWLEGKEQDLPALASAIAKDGPTPLESTPAPKLLDDFERADGRSAIDTRWVNTYEGGLDMSRVLYQRVPRSGRDYAMAIQARMSYAARPRVLLHLPLRRGGVEPMDLSGYKEIEFETRGVGAYRLLLTRRSSKEPSAVDFETGGKWKKVKIPLTALACPCTDVTMLSWELSRPAGTNVWLELDNIELKR